jgi:type IV pilus assembly protein PilX
MKTLSSAPRYFPAKQPLSAGRLRQSGIALVFALVALVAITLATIALVRSVGTGIEIAGNMAFKEATKNAADVAADAAVSWIANNKSALNVSDDSHGYYSNWMSGCDFTGNRTTTKIDDVGWAGAAGGASCTDPFHTGIPAGKSVSISSGMPSGYAASFVVTRMCFCDGPAAGYCKNTTITNSCVGSGGGIGRFHETPTYDNRGLDAGAAGRISASVSPYYRIVTRVAGPRNTVSFIETMVTLDY